MIREIPSTAGIDQRGSAPGAEREASDQELRGLFREIARVEVDEELHGAENMRRDEANLHNVMELQSNSILLRFYSWKPWCLSLGANQKTHTIDTAAMSRLGIEQVHRVTGGRAVLHARELTYSIAMNLPQGTSAADIYRVSHQIILEALQSLNIEGLSFERSQPDFAKLYRTQPAMVACFASAARHEIMHNNRKLVGSAQRVFSSHANAPALLQHGSLLLAAGHEVLADCVLCKSEDERTILREYLVAQSITLDMVAGREVSFKECAEALTQTFTS